MVFDFLRGWWQREKVEQINTRKRHVNLPVSEEAIENTQFGQIVVIGDESAGKSWVLRRLIQMRIFQTGEDIITRHILRVRLRFSASHKKASMVLKIPGKAQVQSHCSEVIHDALKASHDEVADSKKGVSEIEAELTIFSNMVPNIDLIDAPGLLALPADGEPDDLPEKVKKIIMKYITAGTTVLHITDSKSNPRNSPAAQLLKTLKDKIQFHLIKVMTKVDCCLDARQTNGPLSAFLSKFDKENEQTIAVSNYEPHPNATFQEITEEETKLFQKHVPNYESRKSRFGIEAVFQLINSLAKDATYDQWAKKEREEETKRMHHLETELINQGPLLTNPEIADILIDGILQDDTKLEQFIATGWKSVKQYLPTSDLWEITPELPMHEFLIGLEQAFRVRATNVFLHDPQRAFRFQLFLDEFLKRFHNKLEERESYFLTRWNYLADYIMLVHDTCPEHYGESMWLNALISCLNTTFLMHLDDHEHASGPHILSLRQQLISLTRNLLTDEDAKHAKIRADLILQIKEIRDNILPMLN